MEDIFRDLHLEGREASVASPKATEREGVKPRVIMAKEAATSRGQVEKTHIEEDLLEE